jgi:hypothetical protein
MNVLRNHCNLYSCQDILGLTSHIERNVSRRAEQELSLWHRMKLEVEEINILY